MKDIMAHTLSIFVALLLLLVLVAPARAASQKTVVQTDIVEDEPPLPTGTGETTVTNEANAAPEQNLAATINVWYGNNQSFGHRAMPQRQINILGSISGATPSSMTYKLNNGPIVTIPVGTGTSRLVGNTDFNVSIEITNPHLQAGSNSLLLTAGGVSTPVTFNYTPGQSASHPFVVHWNSAASINQVAQVVDGRWTITPAGARTQQTGYDRLIALGDRTWTDYEVLVPITVHKWPLGDGEGGVGIIGHWDGHRGSGTLPDDWWLMGAYGYYSNRTGSGGGLAMYLNQTERRSTGRNVFTMPTGVPYLFKLRVEQISPSTDTSPGTGRYSLKAWPQGQPEPSWNSSTFSTVYNVTDTTDSQTNGGALLVAHNADATFGNVIVCPLNVTYPLIVNVVGGGSVTRSPNKNSYECGEGVTLTPTANPGWTFAGWSGDVLSSTPQLNINVVNPSSLTATFQQSAAVLDQRLFIPSVRK